MSDTSAVDTTGTPASLLQQIQKLQPPKAPTLAPVPAAPVAQITNPLKAMSPGLMLLATLGGALTRAPITTALNNATGFINGVKAGNQYVTKTRLDNFNAAIKQATTANATATDQYKLAMSQYGNDAAKLQQDLLGIASEHGDDPVKALLESGDIKDAVNLIESREKSAIALQEHQDMLNLQVDRAWKPTTLHLADGSFVNGQFNTITNSYRDDSGNPIPTGQVKSILSGIPAEAIITPKAADFAAQLAWAGDWSAATNGVGFGNAANINRTILREAITKYGQKHGYNGTDIAAKIAQFQGQIQAARTVGRVVGATAQGTQEIAQIAPIVKTLSDRVNRTEFPTVNAIELAVRKGTGDPDVVALNSYIQTLRNAYVQVMARGGNLTDTQRRYASELISGSLSTEQLDAAVQAITTEGAVAQSAAARAMQEATGQKITAPPAAAVTPNLGGAPSNVIRYDANGNRIP